MDQIRLKYQLTPSQIFQLHSELASTKQQPHETVDNYAERIEQLCNRLNIEDPAKTHHFVQGLQDLYKAHVLRTEPVEFDDARTAARAEEGAQSLIATRTEEPSDEVSKLAVKLAAALNAVTVAPEKKQSVTSVRCQSCHQMGHTTYNNACQLCGSPLHLAPQCPSLLNQQQNYHYHPQGQPHGKPENKRCYNCGEIGHFRNTCPQLSRLQYRYRDPVAECPPPKESYERPYNPGNAGVLQPQYGYRDPVTERPPPKESYDRPYNPAGKRRWPSSTEQLNLNFFTGAGPVISENGETRKIDYVMDAHNDYSSYVNGVNVEYVSGTNVNDGIGSKAVSPTGGPTNVNKGDTCTNNAVVAAGQNIDTGTDVYELGTNVQTYEQVHNNVSKQVHSTISNQGENVQNVCNAVYGDNVKVPNIQTCSGVNHVTIKDVNYNDKSKQGDV